MNPIVCRPISSHNLRQVLGLSSNAGVHMGCNMPRLGSLSVVFCLLFAAAGVAAAQQIHLPAAISQGQGMGNVPVVEGGDVQRQQALAANAQRQVEIRRDMEKMSELTQELKDYLFKGEQGVASVDAVKKAEQIEKLAKSVRSKMKQSF